MELPAVTREQANRRAWHNYNDAKREYHSVVVILDEAREEWIAASTPEVAPADRAAAALFLRRCEAALCKADNRLRANPRPQRRLRPTALDSFRGVYA